MAETPITVFSFPTADDVQPGPFCLKLEVWLKMAGLPFTVARATDPRKAPGGKIPYARLGDELVGDSARIIERLRRAHGVTLDDGLSDEQRGRALAITRLVEDHFYFILVYARWLDDAVWPRLRQGFFGRLPAPLRWFIPEMARRNVAEQLRQQGTARRAPEEIYAAAEDDLSALAGLLGDQPWFLGDQPRSVDAAVYGQIGTALFHPLETRLKPMIEQHDNLVAYAGRMREAYGT